MESSRLRPLFARALRASLVSPLLLTGCGAKSPKAESPKAPETARLPEAPKVLPKAPEPPKPAELSLEGYVSPACERGGLSLSGLSPAAPPDSTHLYEVMVNPPSRSERARTGTACATATQPEACHAALGQLRPPLGFRSQCLQFCSHYFLATTRGDDVSAIDTWAGLRAFLGPIDTAQEAALLAFAQGYNLECGEPGRGGVRPRAEGGFQVIATRGFACGEGTEKTRHVLAVSTTGELREERQEVLERGEPNCAVGRRPEGLRAVDGVSGTSALGRHFAAVAHLEAASIQAFLRLREELALHGADASLQDAALTSALEEVMHTRVSTRLAHRFGATPPRPHVEARAPRSLFEVARDNAVEGCTRETYGALVAHHQALHARDEQVRGALARIAEDETRHAELSWALERWATPRLSEPERAAVREARRAAVETLRAEVSAPLDAELVTEAGLPSPEAALALLASLEQELWA